MLISILQAVGGLAMLYFGGEWLVKGASALAARMGTSPLAIGLTVVAFGTSLPELVVSVEAALTGANDISVGNVVGSNIANIALILGITALLRPTKVIAKVVRVDAPLMIVASLVMVGILANQSASRVEGAFLLVGLVAYTIYTFWEARRESQSTQEEFAEAAPRAQFSIPISVLLIVLGLGLLAGGGSLLVTAAVDLASTLGVSQAVIGLTVVAVGTSLPELATSVIASLKGRGDIAIGNVVGSNIFNILGVLAGTAVICPLTLGAITRVDLGVMIALSITLTIFLYTRLKLDRLEGCILLTGYIAYTSWLLLP